MINLRSYGNATLRRLAERRLEKLAKLIGICAMLLQKKFTYPRKEKREKEKDIEGKVKPLKL